MNNLNERQHSISQVLLNRFKTPGNPLQCYQVQTGEWIERSVQKACAWPGYNQFLESGRADNKLEDEFSKVESGLRKTFKALEDAARTPLTELAPAVYENMCRYCAFLKLVALYAKPGAVVSFVSQINMELERGEYFLLRDLKIPEGTIDIWRKERELGRRIIIESENALQSLYRFQFQQSYGLDYSLFLRSQWIVSVSPVEIPLSDVGLVPIHLPDARAMHYILPIGPKLVLEGTSFFDLAKHSSQPAIKGHTFTPEQAEYRSDYICASAVTEIICSHKIPNLSASFSRANSRGIIFNKIPNPQAITSAGIRNTSDELRFRAVSVDEYIRFVHSFMVPPNFPSSGTTPNS